MRQSPEILKAFNTSTLKQIFWKMKIFFKKLEDRFLIKSAKIENTSFSYKTPMYKWNGEYKMDLTVRTNFYQQLLYFLKNFDSERFLSLIKS